MESQSSVSLFFKVGILLALIGISYFKTIPVAFAQNPIKTAYK